MLAFKLHLLRDSNRLGPLCGWGLREPFEEAIRVLHLIDGRLLASLDARPDIIPCENEVVRLDLFKDCELEVGIWRVIEDMGCQS